MVTEAQKKAKQNYRKKNTRVTVEFYHGTDAELIEFLERQQGSKSGYIKRLIAEDIKKSEKI